MKLALANIVVASAFASFSALSWMAYDKEFYPLLVITAITSFLALITFLFCFFALCALKNYSRLAARHDFTVAVSEFTRIYIAVLVKHGVVPPNGALNVSFVEKRSPFLYKLPEDSCRELQAESKKLFRAFFGPKFGRVSTWLLGAHGFTIIISSLSAHEMINIRASLQTK